MLFKHSPSQEPYDDDTDSSYSEGDSDQSESGDEVYESFDDHFRTMMAFKEYFEEAPDRDQGASIERERKNVNTVTVSLTGQRFVSPRLIQYIQAYPAGARVAVDTVDGGKCMITLPLLELERSPEPTRQYFLRRRKSPGCCSTLDVMRVVVLLGLLLSVLLAYYGTTRVDWEHVFFNE